MNNRQSPVGLLPSPAMRPSSLTEPLSPGRFRIQFTADAALKDTLELARDLLRHAVPSGDLAAIIRRALDLLVTETQKRRFGAKSDLTSAKPRMSRKARSASTATAMSAKPRATHETTPNDNTSATNVHPETRTNDGILPTDLHEANDRPANGSVLPTHLPGATETLANDDDIASTHLHGATDRLHEGAATVDNPPAASVDRATRRAVCERDGFQCTWHGADGVRCSSRAWLEHDHRVPRALGGTMGVRNLRLLCKAHNRRAAELIFGKQYIETSIIEKQTRRRPSSKPPERP